MDKYEELLYKFGYDPEKINYLVSGFRHGFSIGYEGPTNVKLTSENLNLRGLGTKTDLWNKIMKEVQAKRYAGPFKDIPFENYIQSPLGLVPKDGGTKTRLIFHLSYPRGADPPRSVNGNTPPEKCKVQYKDLEHAIRLCLKAGKGCHAAKSDYSSAFRHLCIKPDHWKYLVMKAESPFDNQIYYFVDKCLQFGASISCAHFQAFSDSVAFIFEKWTGEEIVNYLDDYFFVALLEILCNAQVEIFLHICHLIRFPVSMEKTFWGSTKITFLGYLIDTENQLVSIPLEKIQKARKLIKYALDKPNHKLRLVELQSLCGYLNFICKCILPGKVFMHRLYSRTEGVKKPDHHVRLTLENRRDLEMWQVFLKHPASFCRSLCDFDKTWLPIEIDLYTDASSTIGAGGFCGSDWFSLQWDQQYLQKYKPSIGYLELYAVTVAVMKWIHLFRNKKIALFCDNMGVVFSINKQSSSCSRCMLLLRIIVLHELIFNVRITARHVAGKTNIISDWLSRNKIQQFKKHFGYRFQDSRSDIPTALWPMEK